MSKEIMNHTLSNDKVFKRAFDEEKYINSILKDLEIVSGDIQDLKIENSVDEGDDITLKSTIYDIKISMINEDVKTFVNLEMQNHKPNYNIKNRIMYYFSKMINRSQPKGATYLDNRCIVVMFLNYTLIDDNKYIREMTVNDKVNFEISEHKIYIVELTKVDFCDKKKIRRWLEIFNAKDLEDFKKEGGIMKDLAEKLEQINKDRIFQAYLDSIEIKEKDMLSEKEAVMKKARAEGLAEGLAEGRAEGIAEGIAEGKAEGRAEGIAEGKAKGKAEGEKIKSLEIARMMKNKKFSNEDIAELTGLTIGEIERI